jgi:hypothetical protein
LGETSLWLENQNEETTLRPAKPVKLEKPDKSDKPEKPDSIMKTILLNV